MSRTRLDSWLGWFDSGERRQIDLGLERLRAPAARLGVDRLGCQVIKVAGTNGKGSSVAMLEALLRGAGYRVAAYTSPVIDRFEECLRIDGVALEEDAWVQALDAVERAREGVALTAFEHQTLAAAVAIERAGADVALMEMGLGGARDAVNVLAADAVLFTAIDVDHRDWLGDTREAIAREKAGAMAPGVLAVSADCEPPRALTQTAAALGVPIAVRGRDFEARTDTGAWTWRFGERSLGPLAFPGIGGRHQVHNAAGVLALLHLMREKLPVPEALVGPALERTRLAGRHQVLGASPWRMVDVAHNVQAARALVSTLSSAPPHGRTLIVLGMLADKDAEGVAEVLGEVADAWFLAGLEGPRGRSAPALEQAVRAGAVRGPLTAYADPGSAWSGALAQASTRDRVVACGSFLVVREVLRLESSSG